MSTQQDPIELAAKHRMTIIVNVISVTVLCGDVIVRDISCGSSTAELADAIRRAISRAAGCAEKSQIEMAVS